jgi:hypothetical protein
VKNELPRDDYDDHEEEAGYTITLADIFIAFFAITLCLFTLLLLEPHNKNNPTSVSTAGVMCVEMSWPERNIDLDLWSHAPGEAVTVGFTNLHSHILDLLRDVTGFAGNPNHIMLEMVCANQLKPGEWTFNMHYYGNHEDEFAGKPTDYPGKQVTVTMIARFKGQRDFMTQYTTKNEGEEHTMLDFVIGESGMVVYDSINSRQVPLRSGWKK